MNVELQELNGDEEYENLSAGHAVKQGAHDALSDLVKYGTMAAIVAVGSVIILDKKTITRLKNRWL